MKNVNESGRSMVEMLGVLAIIGVLSVGGIAGYTRAMRNWRANEIIDAANKVAAMIETEIATGDLTYNKMVGSSETNANKGPVGQIAGGVVSQIQAYGESSTNANAGKVVITLMSGNDELIKVIKEKLGCEGNGDTCYLGKTKECVIS